MYEGYPTENLSKLLEDIIKKLIAQYFRRMESIWRVDLPIKLSEFGGYRTENASKSFKDTLLEYSG